MEVKHTASTELKYYIGGDDHLMMCVVKYCDLFVSEEVADTNRLERLGLLND